MSEEMSKDMISFLAFDYNRSETNSFDFRKKLFDFRVDSDLSVNERQLIPRLKDEFHNYSKGLDIDLKEVIPKKLEDKKMIKSNDNNRKRKWIQFLRCLQKQNTIEEEEPTFVTFSSIISDLFVVEEWDWSFFAVKFNGVIYLFRNETLELEEGVEEEISPHAYCIKKFKYLISNKYELERDGFNPSANKTVDRIDLNGNRLIVCYGVFAEHRNGSPVYVKCRQIFRNTITKEYKTRLLRNWSKCVINGAKTLIIGRRYKSILQEVIVRQVDRIPDRCREYWSDSKCFSFVDQSLEYIKSCVGSELELYEFFNESKKGILSCYQYPNSDHFLPEFYTKS